MQELKQDLTNDGVIFCSKNISMDLKTSVLLTSILLSN